MQRIEGILRVIAQDSHSPARVQTAEDSVAKLSAQLIELQQSEAALEGQVISPCLHEMYHSLDRFWLWGFCLVLEIIFCMTG